MLGFYHRGGLLFIAFSFSCCRAFLSLTLHTRAGREMLVVYRSQLERDSASSGLFVFIFSLWKINSKLNVVQILKTSMFHSGSLSF